MQLFCFALTYSISSATISTEAINSSERVLPGDDTTNILSQFQFATISGQDFSNNLQIKLGSTQIVVDEKQETILEIENERIEHLSEEHHVETIGEHSFKEQELAEELHDVSDIVGDNKDLIAKGITEILKGENLKVDSTEIAEDILQEEEDIDTSLSLRTSVNEPEEHILGFDEVCSDKIFKGEDFIISFLVQEHIDVTTLINKDTVNTIVAKIEAHKANIDSYVDILSITQKLFDVLYSQYVTSRVMKLVSMFETELGFQTKCAIPAVDFGPLFGQAITEVQNSVKAKMQYYLSAWEAQDLELDSYRPLATTFFNEISINSDATQMKEVQDRLNKYPAEIKTITTSYSSYKERLLKVNECMCPVLKNIIYMFAGKEDSKFNSLFGGMADNANMKQKDFTEYAKELLDSFTDSITRFLVPKKCGDETNTIQEMIFYVKTNTFITTYKELFSTVSSKEEVWSSFFSIFTDIQHVELRQVIDYDMYLLHPRVYSTELVEKMLEFRSRKVVFHAEFFNLMSNFKTFFVNKGLGQAEIKLTSLRNIFLNWDKKESIMAFQATQEFGYQAMAQLWVSIYKVYVFLRANGKIIQTHTMKDIFIQFCAFFNDVNYYKADESPLYNILFDEGSVGHIYPHLASYVATLAKSYGVEECLKKDTNKVIIDTIPAVNPPNPIIEINIIIIEIFREIVIVVVKKTFKEALIAIGWKVDGCPEGKFKDYNYDKVMSSSRTVMKKTLTPQNEKNFGGVKVVQERKVYRFSNDCIDPFMKKFDDVMNIKGFTEFSKIETLKKDMYKEMIRIFYEVVDELSYEQRGLIFHVMIKWLTTTSTTITAMTEHKKTFTMFMFEVIEKRVIRMLNYYETAGFYGYLMRVKSEEDHVHTEKMYKHKNNEWAKFKVLLKLDSIDKDMLRADLFYLTDQAITNSIPKAGDVDEKMFNTNTQNAIGSLELLFKAIRYRGTTEQVSGWQTYNGFYENVMLCRWNLYEGPQIKNGKVEILDAKFCIQKGIACKTAVNEFKNTCNYDFARKMITYLHTLPILLYGVSAYDTHNYLHKYFKNRIAGKSAWDKKSLARLYMHYQNIRLSTESQVSDIIHFTLDRTLECMSQDKIFPATNAKIKYDSKRFCLYSVRTYAEIYWNLKYQFAINFKDLAFDLSKPEGMPLFGTSILILNAFTYIALKEEFLEACRDINNIEPLVDLCRVFLVVQTFIEETDVKGGVVGSEDFFKRINDITESMTSVTQKTQATFILLEAMYVCENLGNDYEYESGKVMSMLNFKNHYSYNEINIMKKNNFDFDNFLIKETDKDQLELFGTYLYVNKVRNKLEDTEMKLRNILVNFGPSELVFDDFVEFDGHVTSFLFNTMMIYSPSLEFSKALAIKIVRLKWFFEVVTMDDSNGWVDVVMEKYETDCADKKNKANLNLKCFYLLCVRQQNELELKEGVETIDVVLSDKEMEGADEESTSQEYLDRLEQQNFLEINKEDYVEWSVSKKVIAFKTEVTKDEFYSEDFDFLGEEGDETFAQETDAGDVIVTENHTTISDHSDEEIDPLLTEVQRGEESFNTNIDEGNELNETIKEESETLSKNEKLEVQDQEDIGDKTVNTEQELLMKVEEENHDEFIKEEELKTSQVTLIVDDSEFKLNMRTLSGI